jgi:adenylate cyclase
VIAYCQSGRPELAEQTARQLLSLRPNFTIQGWASTQIRREAALLEEEKSALRASGLPLGD